MRAVAYGVTTEDEARKDVRELAARKPDFIKIWVDDRNGAVKKLTPALYRAMIDEAHRHKLRVMAHVYYLTDAHALVEAGVDGFLHLVRDADMDDALVKMMKDRHVFVTPNLSTSEAGTYTRKPAWLDDPLLAETSTFEMIKNAADVYAAREARGTGGAAPPAAVSSYAKQQRSLAKLNAAGVSIALGDDTGIENTFFGYGEHHELELMVAAGMTPMQAIVAATRRRPSSSTSIGWAPSRRARAPTSSSSMPTRSRTSPTRGRSRRCISGGRRSIAPRCARHGRDDVRSVRLQADRETLVGLLRRLPHDDRHARHIAVAKRHLKHGGTR